MQLPECFHLREDELTAVLKLGGVEKVLLFPAEDSDVWNPCCRLVADGLMTQIDGQFRLRRDLFEVVYPIREAKKMLMLTPLDPPGGQVIFYLADRVTMLEKRPFGGYSLCNVEYDDLAETVVQCLDLRYYDGPIHVGRLDLPQTLQPDATRQQLEENAAFVLERLDWENMRTEQWLRGIQNHFVPWVEWNCANEIYRETMTQEHLHKCVQTLIKGEAVV